MSCVTTMSFRKKFVHIKVADFAAINLIEGDLQFAKDIVVVQTAVIIL